MSLQRLFVTQDRRPALLWRLLGYALVFGVVLSLRQLLSPAVESGFVRVLPETMLLPMSNLTVVAAVIAATVGLTYLFRRFVDRRPWAGMAMPSPWRRRRELAMGFAIGAVMLVVVFLCESGFGWLRILGMKEGFGWTAVAAILGGRLIYFVGTATCEEIAYRGYLLQNVGERYPIWTAVLITGAVFGASHYTSNGFTPGFVVGATIASFFLAAMRLLTRGIWLGVGWHLGWDWFEDGLGLVPGYSPLRTERSGPPFWTGTGLAIEGGLLIILVLALALAALLAWSRFAGRAIDWTARLGPNGELAFPRAAQSISHTLTADSAACDGTPIETSGP